MNIFVVDKCPLVAAQQLCDKHVVKMIVEGCQMLSTNHRLAGSQIAHVSFNLYKQSFMNHPCTIWARQTYGNYMWLALHTNELCNEYERRYNRVHTCKPMAMWFTLHPLGTGGLTPFAQAMPDEYKVPGDGVAAYRNYYVGAKSKIAKWKYTNPPDWYSEQINNLNILNDQKRNNTSNLLLHSNSINL